MFNNLVTYHVHTGGSLPANDALAYQYILAGNGLFIRADTPFFSACLSLHQHVVRGLPPLAPHWQLLVPRIPGQLLHTAYLDACAARQPNGSLREVLYQFHHHGQHVALKKPPQQGTAATVVAQGNVAATVLCDLHSHGNMAAFFSQTDNADEQGLRLYAVMGRLESRPEIQLRLGLYGQWQALPVTAVFTDAGPFHDLHPSTPEGSRPATKALPLRIPVP